MREYITDQSSGKLHPTKKGIILSLKVWHSLKKEMKTVNQLLNFAPSSKNLSRAQYQAIEELKANKDIVIKPADKGGSCGNCEIVSDYLAEGYKQLSDEKVYKKLTESKTNEYHKLICDYLKHSYEVEREISRETYLYLTDFIPRTSRMYLLPKIHKPARPPPGRPVISANGSPTERNQPIC